VDRALSDAVAAVASPIEVADRCGAGDEPCLAALARSVGAGAVLYVSLRPVGGTPSLCLTRIDAAPGRPAARAVEALRPGVPVEPPVREAVFRLLAPDRVAGFLEVEATEGSEIRVDGRRQGVAPLPAIGGLAPGQHLLRVVRPGGGEARGTVEVRFEGRTRVRIEPRSDDVVMVGHEEPPPVAEPLPAAALEVPAEPFPVWTVAGWSAVGAGGALAAGALIPVLAAARARDEARALRDPAGRLPASRVDEDRRLAEEAAGHDRTATALLAVGASLVASGVTVLLLDLDAEEP
jgi:hypothetical protein